ncbi:hypothetical protein HPB51_012102 [Rhipicephalus microplus]|uniref:Uncharacterized protein n=1 Tax=Rhipicephalus microplus TaxID=6941 RepID=A0A9J6DM83_RHIMP|nr:hypothetical protein HPB51_012102 [Rhipicephalus microplus]
MLDRSQHYPPQYSTFTCHHALFTQEAPFSCNPSHRPVHLTTIGALQTTDPSVTPAALLAMLLITVFVSAVVMPTNKSPTLTTCHSSEHTLYIKLSTMFATKATEPSTKTFIREDTADNNSLRYKGLLKSEDIPCDFAANVLGTLLEKYHENYFEYLSTYAFGSVFNNTVIEMWTNPLSLLGSWILQNLIDTTLLIQQTGQPNARFDTGISVVQMTTEEAKINSHMNYPKDKEPALPKLDDINFVTIDEEIIDHEVERAGNTVRKFSTWCHAPSTDFKNARERPERRLKQLSLGPATLDF